MKTMKLFNNKTLMAQEIFKLLGPQIRLVTPLGLGKPVQLLNALYEEAKKNAALELTIFTALTLYRPKLKNKLADMLLKPFFERVYGDYEDLLYEKDRRRQCLPKNIKVIEFFLAAGEYVNNAYAQQNFIYCNYTHVINNLMPHDINLIATMVQESKQKPNMLSLSSNADLTPDLICACPKALLVGQIHDQLPYMLGKEVEIEKDKFSSLLNNHSYNKKLFSVPKMPLNYQDYAIGFLASSLVKDDGCLQIGIGNLSDALIYGLIKRHTSNQIYVKLLQALGLNNIDVLPFKKGLSALTEMLVDGYLELYNAGILKRTLNHEDVIAHAGFFLGSNLFYKRLKTMSEQERKRFSMRGISEINQLYGNEIKKRQERQNACFINTCMKITILGEIISDSLANGITISGVGGQYNFVAMAHELNNAKSIMLCRSTFIKNGRVYSNIIFNHGPSTVSRHLRDVVITEYGIAHVRGKCDEEVIKAIINIADSRFQQELIKKAIKAKKLPSTYQIPVQHRTNYPEKIKKTANNAELKNMFLRFPFGSEFKECEIPIILALEEIKKSSNADKCSMFIRGMFASHEQKITMKQMMTKKMSLLEWITSLMIMGALP